MEAVFPLAKKYGGLIVALTLDEDGIPNTAEGRVAIAKRILAEAKKYGIDKKDIIFDTLAMAVSADTNAAKETLRALGTIRRELGANTSLGVSNVSFGLPSRDTINGTFFALALNEGLSAAIMNPYSHEMMKTYYAYRALAGLDVNCSDFISFAEKEPATATVAVPVVEKPIREDKSEDGSELQRAVVKGLKDIAAQLTAEMVRRVPPLTVVQEHIIPALNTVGIGFENKTVYLPQLLMSAEAAKSAFEVIKSEMSGTHSADKCAIVIATVKGDIHDIGKNIVKLLLENYGFAVTDLGRDVEPERIVKEVVRLHAPIVGLSALMTTTVPYMQETISLLRRDAPWCKIIVGGAVLTKEYSSAIGADAYGKDAMEAVRLAMDINSALSKE